MTNAWTLNKTKTGIAVLILDCVEEKLNTLSGSVLMELDTLCDELAGASDIKALIISTLKPGCFIAGADITEIQDITDPEDGAKKAAIGQSIFNKIDDLPYPTIALISGACLGGGLEFALACDYRIATDHKKTIIGLPEVNLGIIPGFGGTQRMPRLIGLQKSLDLILAGKTVDAKKAQRLGLIDKMVPEGFKHIQTHAFVQSLLNNSGHAKIKKTRHAKKTILDKIPMGKWVLYFVAKKTLMKKTKGHYPAPLSALKVMRQTYGVQLKSGLKIESAAFGALVPTDVSKSLIQLFFANEALKKDTGTPESFEDLAEIQSAGVLGAGLMGGGIGWTLSNKNILVRLKDITWDAIAMGYEAAAAIYAKGVKRRKLTQAQATMRMGKLTGTTDYSGFSGTDIVIEAIPENMELKKKIYKELESEVSDSTIIASNTSALSIDEMQKELQYPGRFIGMHFFSPVNRMPLVEIIPGDQTSNETIARTVQLSKTMGKTPIVVKNCPGFLVNRILLPYVNEAVHLLMDGADMDEIDQVACEFGMPLGPLALADEVGLDVGMKVSLILEQGFGKRMSVPDLFHKVLSDETLRGKKTKQGFYTYSKKSKTQNTRMKALIKDCGITQKNPSKEDILDRLILTMVGEAARCIEEEIVASPMHLDMAMILGTGFPPFRGGLLRYTDKRGLSEIKSRLDHLSDTVSSRFSPASLINKLAKENKAFYT